MTLAWYKSAWKYMNFGNSVLPSTFLGVLPIGLILYVNGQISPQNLVICLILSLGVVGPMMNFTNYINEAKAIEYALHDVSSELETPVLSDSEKDIEIKEFQKDKDKRVGRLLPPYITRIQQKWAHYVVRTGVLPVPENVVFPNK